MDKKGFFRAFRHYLPTSILAAVLLLVDITFFQESPWFFPMIILAAAIAFAPSLLRFFLQLQKQKEVEGRFPEFIRNLSGAIRTGMPAPRAIIHVAKIDYGALAPYVRKLANQIEWSIPVHKALLNFANDTKNLVIKRAISSVIEAEMSGGNIEDVLESITSSVVDIKKLKQARRAATHAQVVQSYVIFAVFLIVMVIIQNILVPYLHGLEQTGAAGNTGLGGISILRTSSGLGGLTMNVEIDMSSLPKFVMTLGQWFVSLEGVFLMTALIQALFAGLVIGKLSEGSVIYGVKHSIILMIAAFFIVSLAQGFL